MRNILIGAAALLMTTSGAALSQEVVMGDTTGGPTWQRPFLLDRLSGAGKNVPFVTQEVTITDAMAFIAEITAAAAGFDTFIHIYKGAFDPTAPLTNLVGLDDDDGAGLLSRIRGTDNQANASVGPYPEGLYTIVVTGFNDGDFGTFTLTLTGAVIGFAGQLTAEMKSTLAQFARLSTTGNAEISRRAAEDSFAARDALQFFQLTPGGDTPVVSTQNGQMMGNTYAWLEFSGFQAQGKSSRKYSGTGVQGGLDFGLGQNVVLGLSVGYTDLSARTPLAATSGEYTFVQPYLGYRRGDWSAQLSFSYGETAYTQTSIGGVGTADGEVMAVNLSVARDLALSEAVTMTPMVAFHYGEEKITGKTGTLAAAGKTTVEYSELSVGARLSQRTMLGRQYVGLHVDYSDSNAPNSLTAGGFENDGASGRVEMGTAFAISDRGQIDFGVEAGGLGSGLTEYAGQLRVTFGF